MEHSLGHIATEVDGELVGSADLMITGVEIMNTARPDQITFATSDEEFHKLESADSCKAGAVLVPRKYTGNYKNVIKVDKVNLAVAKTIALFHSEKSVRPHISSRADIRSTVRLGKDVYVGPHASIDSRSVIGNRVVIQSGVHIGKDVIIGDDTTLSYNVVVAGQTYIGKRVVVQEGSVIGHEGFGYIDEPGKGLIKIIHIGNVVIEDDVVIGANNTIERGNVGPTYIQQGVKTGSQVHIGHNTTIGKNSRITTMAGIAGNVTIGKNVFVGPQAGIDRGLVVGDNAFIGSQAGVITAVADNERICGTPGMSCSAWLRSASLIPELSVMKRQIDKLS